MEFGTGDGILGLEIVKRFPECKISLTDIIDDFESEINSRAGKKVFRPSYSIEDSPDPNQKYDVIVGRSVLYNLDCKKALGEIFRLLKPFGMVSICEPFTEKMKEVPDLLDQIGFSHIESYQKEFEFPLPTRKWETALDIRVHPDSMTLREVLGKLPPKAMEKIVEREKIKVESGTEKTKFTMLFLKAMK